MASTEHLSIHDAVDELWCYAHVFNKLTKLRLCCLPVAQLQAHAERLLLQCLDLEEGAQHARQAPNEL